MKQPLPSLHSDEQAERFVDEADLSEYDLSGGRQVRFHFTERTATVTLRSSDLDAATARAASEGVPLDAYLGRLVHDRLEQLA